MGSEMTQVGMAADGGAKEFLAQFAPEAVTTAAEIVTVTSPEACPWPAPMRDGRCVECRRLGGATAITTRGLRQRYATAACLAAQTQQRAAVRLTGLVGACGLVGEALAHTFDRLGRDRYNTALLAELQAWRPAQGVGFYITRVPEGHRDYVAANPYGNGTGKSWALHALTLRLCAAGVAAVYVNASELLPEIKAVFGGKESAAEESAVFARYATAPVLVVDDLGAELVGSARSEWGCNTWYRLLDRRAEAGLPTFVASNYTLGELRGRFVNEQTGAKVVSRILRVCDNTSRRLGGPDRRMPVQHSA